MKEELASARDFLRQNFPSGTRMLCAVSGGLDSMCLLAFLSTWGKEQGFFCSAAHFNHQLRGQDADRDERFVTAYCTEHGIPLRCGRGNVSAAAAETGESLEEAGRRLRYAFLEQTAQELDCPVILTAHHADDQAETVLWHLIRGSGSLGLAGIPARRGRIARPFLAERRQALERYADIHGVPHVEDATNQDTAAASRNALRHQVLPILEGLNSQAVEHIGAAAAVLRRESQALDQWAASLLHASRQKDGSLSCPPLRTVPQAVRERTLLRWLREQKGLGRDLGAAHLAALETLVLRSGGASVSLPGGITAERQGESLSLSAPCQQESQVLYPAVPCRWGDWCLTLRTDAAGEGLSLAAGTEPVTVRYAPPGAFLHLPGSRGGRSVKRLCRDRGISPTQRARLPALYLGETLAAVWPLGVDEASRPKGGSLRFIQIQRNQEIRGEGS